MNTMTLIDQIEELEFRIRRKKEDFLRDKGWTYSCETPGSLWLWKRDWRGQRIMVDTDTAIHMQGQIDSGVYEDV